MDLSIYNAVEQFVFDSFTKVEKPSQIKHFVRTVHWLKVLSPNADEALLIAAISHDIERAFRQKDMAGKRALGWTNVEFFRPHEERGAEIVGEFLQQKKVDKNFIQKVKMLISRHEEGGNDDQNLLKDADSISFFETNISSFLEGKSLEMGKEKIKQKFDWMFNRITSPKAKQIAQPFYETALKALNEVQKFNII
ncbi:DUF4202 family protein [Candidatus Gracilibacteria bacterium]|nr:DUF4202 family protein [Candidatus Gracilibacteria bacterium]